MRDGVLSVIDSGIYSEFEWEIKNFSQSQGRCYCSPKFKFEEESWCLEVGTIYPPGYIHLSLWRSSSGSPIDVEFSAAIKTTEGRKIFEGCERHYFEEGGEGCEIKEWIRMTEFNYRQREFLWSDCFIIVLTMKRTKLGESESESGTMQSSVFSPKSKVLQDLKQMFFSQENCDVVLRVQGKEFSAHKNILVARSPVLASTFRSNMEVASNSTVDIEDIDPSCFPEFLRFLYCGEVENLSAENVRSLFAAADKYHIKHLRAICVNFMKKNMSVDAFCETLVLSLLHTESDLIDVCADFFVQNAEKILETVQWRIFAAENPMHSNELLIKYVKANKSPCLQHVSMINQSGNILNNIDILRSKTGT